MLIINSIIFIFGYDFVIRYLCIMKLNEITATIKQARKEQKLTLEQLSQLTGDKKQYLNLIENGANTKVNKLITICQALNLEVIVRPKQ